MPKTFDEILDECVDRINRGERLEDCLASYPEHAEELEPLLQAMLRTQTAYTFTLSSTAKMAARQRFNASLEKLERKRAERRPLFPRALGWSAAWAAVAAVLVMALVGYFGIRPALSPGEPTPHPGPLPGPQGTLAFLISDEKNDIGDFQSLNITITKIHLHLAGEDGGLIELEPQETVDLTKLQGLNAQEIWRGNITAGNYTWVRIYVSEVSGVLFEGNQTAYVKLPSEKLKISEPFEVTEDSETSFVYDITVFETGKRGKYILQPQIDQSGADQPFELIDGEGGG